jgi:transposase
MSLKPQEWGPIPEETVRIARAAYPKGNVWMQMRDELGTIYQDEAVAHLFSHTGQPAEAPWRLAVVTVMQFAEGLSDRQAADAVRGRIDFKYALGVELSDSGFDHTVLSEFRARLVAGNADQMLLDTLLALFKERGWLKARGKQRTDSTHVLAKIRALNRVLCVGETLRKTLKYTFSGVLSIEPKHFLDSGIEAVECPNCAAMCSLELRKGILRFPSHDERKTGTTPPDQRWAMRESTWEVVGG